MIQAKSEHADDWVDYGSWGELWLGMVIYIDTLDSDMLMETALELDASESSLKDKCIDLAFHLGWELSYTG